MQRVVGRTGIYGLLEWARTEEGENAFVFASVLAEASVLAGRHRIGYRVEHTGRPEEERYFDNLFRSPRPLLDNSIVGQSEWTLHTINYALQLALAGGKVGVQPFVEVTFGQVTRHRRGAVQGGGALRHQRHARRHGGNANRLRRQHGTDGAVRGSGSTR